MRLLVLTWVLFLLAATVAAQDLVPEAHLEQKFLPGGNIQMHLAPGDYSISGTLAERVRVTYRPAGTTSGPVRVELQAAGSNASLTVRHTSHQNFHADIEVPVRSDLLIRLGAGDLNVQGVAGSKDVEVHAGDVNIDVRRPEDYQQVEASVSVGDLTAPAFNVSKDGFARSFKRHGPGAYRLHVHVGAGDLRLYETD
ncbi:MAG TPA: hypothetical protein VKR26_02625 [Terriglobales bacterium]|nr:hypothetical protein [Terriglobales bacterium]